MLTAMNTPASPLFPELQPFATHMLEVEGGHTLYIEQSGNPSGIPVIAFHGGPGSGSSDKARRRFDPALYHIVVYDQRGAGKSTPAGNLAANTTQHLMEDINLIRVHLKLGAVVLYGTSWGSTLALAYAQKHPANVLGLILGGIFLGTRTETNWITEPTGLPHLRWPEYQALLATIPDTIVPTSLEHTLLQLITGPDAGLARRVAEAYSIYEGSACFPEPDYKAIHDYAVLDATLVPHIAIELHYFANAFFLMPNQLLENIATIAHLPVTILQGGLDIVCPPAAAYVLHAALPKSEFTLVPSSGHVANDTMEAARCTATTAFAVRLRP